MTQTAVRGLLGSPTNFFEVSFGPDDGLYGRAGSFRPAIFFGDFAR